MNYIDRVQKELYCLTPEYSVDIRDDEWRRGYITCFVSKNPICDEEEGNDALLIFLIKVFQTQKDTICSAVKEEIVQW